MTAETMTFTCWRTILLIKQNSKSCWFFTSILILFWLSSLRIWLHECHISVNLWTMHICRKKNYSDLNIYVFKDRSIPGQITMFCTHSDFQFWLPVRRFHPCRRKVNDILMQKAIPDIRLSWFLFFISTKTRKYKWYWQVDLTDCQNTCWTHTMAMYMHQNLDFLCNTKHCGTKCLNLNDVMFLLKNFLKFIDSQ